MIAEGRTTEGEVREKKAAAQAATQSRYREAANKLAASDGKSPQITQQKQQRVPESGPSDDLCERAVLVARPINAVNLSGWIDSKHSLVR